MALSNSEVDYIPPPKADFSAPPPYEIDMGETNQMCDEEHWHHIRLPTYDDVEREKSLNGELQLASQLPSGISCVSRSMQNPLALTPVTTSTQASLAFIGVDLGDAETLTNDNHLLGTDIVFITAFIISFLFNWIGFLMMTCFCHTIAARYGSLSGFGLSLAKWTLIVKNSTDLASHENSWLWWLIMAFGFFICVRAFLQYVSIKRTWRLLSISDQERLLFFY